MYTDDRNAQIVLALLKEYNVKKIVVSPGMTNVPISRSVQIDPFFEVYSVFDERSAAYFANGLAYETGEPVALSCTGATASRNYLPALTEAFYRNLPVIALTSQQYSSDYGNFKPQYVNREKSPVDVKRISVNLPIIKDRHDEEAWIISVNRALTLATIKGAGPVHINLFVNSHSFTSPKLPDISRIQYYNTDDILNIETINTLQKKLINKKIAILIGSHRKFQSKEIMAIERFVSVFDAIVLYDHSSNYHGRNKILLSVAAGLKMIDLKPDIVIDIGGVTGVYSAASYLKRAEFWRISEDGEFHQRFGNLSKLFDCTECVFFDFITKNMTSKSDNYFYNTVEDRTCTVEIPSDIPFSNIYVSSQIASKLPSNSSFHIGASESFSCMNFFQIKDTVDTSCNVGTMGIDGAVSTLIGQSMADHQKLFFGQFGDLTFFYDMNILGNRHINKNVRILLVNNGVGVRFRVTDSIERIFGSEINEFIAAAGHNGSAKGWATSAGFEYISANSKNDFLMLIDDFCSSDLDKYDKPVIFEVFTSIENEQDGLTMFRKFNTPTLKSPRLKKIVKDVLPPKAVNYVKKINDKFIK